MRIPRWTLHETADSQWALRLRAGNSEKLLWSESHPRRDLALRAWRRTRWLAVVAFLFGLKVERL